MKAKVFYMVDAALLFRFGDTGILIDGVHEGQLTGFSPMPDSMERDLRTLSGIYSDLSAAVFTHLHPDHFERERLAYLIEHSKGLYVYGPELEESNVRPRSLSDDLCVFQVNDAEVTAVRNTHDGELFGDDPHRSLILKWRDEAFFIGGDALLLREETEVFRDLIPSGITAAFVNPYQAGTPEGREYIKKLRPERVILYHMPFPEDDKDNYWMWSRSILRQWPDDIAPLEVPEPMQWI